MAANPNVMFKRGTQANLNNLASATEGVFYLTTDTNRLYVGGTAADGDKGFKLLNSIVNIVDSLSTLLTASSAWTTDAAKAAHKNDFYYITDSNILCVWTKKKNSSDYDWVQINPDTNDDTTNATLTHSVSTTSGTATITTKVEDSEGASVSDTFSIKAGTAISITSSGEEITVAGETYDIDFSIDTTNKATIKLNCSNTARNDSFIIEGGDNITIDKNGDNLRIKGQDFSLDEASISLGNDGKLSVSVSDNSSASASATSGVIGVSLNDGSFLNLSNRGTGTIADGEIYSKAQIDTKLNGLDGMTYMGTVGTSGSTVSALPTSNVKNGDVYVVVSSGMTASSAALSGVTLESGTSSALGSTGTVIGDMFIAKGTEGDDGYITSASLKWTYIPSGNDSLDAVTYSTAVDTTNNSLLMSNADTTGILGLSVAAGASGDIVVSSTKSTNGNTDDTLNLTVEHKAYTTGDDDNDLASIITTGSKADKTDTYTAITGITLSNGHVTGITKREFEPHSYELAEVTSAVSTTSGVTTATNTVQVTDDNGTASGDSVNISINSSSLTLEKTAAGNTAINIVWGDF